MTSKFHKATDTVRELFCYYLVMIVVFAGIFTVIEHVSFTDALYWAGITAPTLGYGDVVPHTTAGKVVSVILVNVSAFILAPLIIARLLSLFMHDPDKFTHDEQEDIKRTMGRLERFLDGAEKTCTHSSQTDDPNGYRVCVACDETIRRWASHVPADPCL